MEAITPFLWFNNEAEEAVAFYCSIFKESKVVRTVRYTEQSEHRAGKSPGSVMTIHFELNGQPFLALNGGPHFQITPAVSFVIPCEDQDEIDYYWESLSVNPECEQCGWLLDKFGVSWQVVPKVMGELLNAGDADQRNRTMETIIQMKKINIEKLREVLGDSFPQITN